jgi:hypothetical protein
MFRLLLRVALAVLLFRFLGGLLRAIGGGTGPDSRERTDPRPSPPKPLVDRASAIDVPFTEERQEG